MMPTFSPIIPARGVVVPATGVDNARLLPRVLGGREHRLMSISEQEGVLEAVNGRRIGWMTRGVPDGRIVGWLHGQPGSRRDTRVFPDDLLERHGLRFLSIDRAGYGDTAPVGLDRRDVARDLFTVADDLGVRELPVVAVSMGGIYALTAAALSPDRVSRVVLVSAHVLPYDDPAVVTDLSAAEQRDLALLRAGRTPEVESEYAAAGAEVLADPPAALRGLAETMSARERVLAASVWGAVIGASLAHGLSAGHAGYLEDGLRTLRPLEVELADVRCPVRAVHGEVDDLEPYANLRRLAPRLPDCQVLALPGLGHFGPFLWPDVVLGMLRGE